MFFNSTPLLAEQPMTVTPETIQSLLARTTDPLSGLAYGDIIKDLKVDGQTQAVSLTLVPGYPVEKGRAAVLAPLTAALNAIGLTEVQITLTPKIEAHAIRSGVDRVPGVKNIIAVASGKGGVGKSTTAVNLALALRDEGAKVGLLDADIYGPSVPLLLNVSGRPDSSDGKTMEPMIGLGLKASSIGFLVSADSPAIWRGPMVTQALEQLLRKTNWGDLDYLIVDMPPGTGDIALTLAQRVPVTGAIIVTTPQDIALLDARKGLKMFQKVEVPVLGVVENMAVHICSNCGHVEHMFGEGGADRMAEEFSVPCLGRLPLALSIRVDADAGCPTVAASPDSEAANLYRDIARRLVGRIAVLPKDMRGKFPSVVVEKKR
jgi:ATP-binding protein involved in chromosome partitioning